MAAVFVVDGLACVGVTPFLNRKVLGTADNVQDGLIPFEGLLAAVERPFVVLWVQLKPPCPEKNSYSLHGYSSGP